MHAGADTGEAGAQRRIQRTVTQLQQCLPELDPSERRVLSLRAGLGPGGPLTRPQVARRLDLGIAQAGRIERRGLRRLDALAGDGACVGAAAGGLATATDDVVGASGTTTGAGASDLRPPFGVGGVVAHGGGDSGSDHHIAVDALPPPIGDGGDATLLVALGLLVALALLVRRELSRR